jgi:hypothetical protein
MVLHDFTAELHDFEDTVALIVNLATSSSVSIRRSPTWPVR